MLKSIKTLLWAALVASLSLGFASCSSDSDDEDDGLEGVKVKRLPVKITETIDNGRPKVWTFEYDAANRMSKSRFQEITYDANGYISKLGIWDYRYNAKEGIIEIFTGEWRFGWDYFVDAAGFYRSYHIESEEFDGEVFKSTETYDSKRNHLERNYADPNDTVHWTASYSGFYSPFAAVVIPRWTLQDKKMNVVPYFGIHAVGVNMPKEAKGRYTYHDRVFPFEQTFEVVKSEDNYPTEFVITNIEDKMLTKTTYLIEYKDAN